MRAKHYTETVDRLAADPIVRAMAEELPPGMDMEGLGFMLAAKDEYYRRGGADAGHVGGVAEAIRKLRS